jgi:hypothetical protein
MAKVAVPLIDHVVGVHGTAGNLVNHVCIAMSHSDEPWPGAPQARPRQAPVTTTPAAQLRVGAHAEYLLRSWCQSLSENLALPASYTTKKKGESTLLSYLRYMRDEAKLDLGDFTKWPEWEPIDAYRRTRNCLAHNGGVVERSEDRAKIGALPHIEVDDSGLQLSAPMVHLLPGACEAATEITKALLERLLTIAENDTRSTTTT